MTDIKRTISVIGQVLNSTDVDLFFRNHLFGDEYYIYASADAIPACDNWIAEIEGTVNICTDLRSINEYKINCTKDYIYIALYDTVPNAVLRHFIDLFKTGTMDIFNDCDLFRCNSVDASTCQINKPYEVVFHKRLMSKENCLDMPFEFHQIKNVHNMISYKDLLRLPITSQWTPGELSDLEHIANMRGNLNFNQLWIMLIASMQYQYARQKEHSSVQ